MDLYTIAFLTNEILAAVRQDYAVLYAAVSPWYDNGAEELIHFIPQAGLLLKVILISLAWPGLPGASLPFRNPELKKRRQISSLSFVQILSPAS